MTQQERDLLQSLADRIAATQVPDKDPQAQAFILQKIGSKPDALYILTQTVLIQEMALNQANKRLHELSEQQGSFVPGAPAQPTSFLGRLFGFGAPPPPPPVYYPEPVYQAPGSGYSFLRSAAATATGVAAGALAFEGIEALLHGGFGGGYGGYGGGEFLQGAPNETIINNYYDNDSGNSSPQQDFSSDTNIDTSSDTNYDSSSDSSGDGGGGDYSSNDS